MGEERQEKIPSLPFLPSVLVPGGTAEVSILEVLWESVTANRREGTRLGRIIPARHFSFNLGFQPLLEKLITSKMQK